LIAQLKTQVAMEDQWNLHSLISNQTRLRRKPITDMLELNKLANTQPPRELSVTNHTVELLPTTKLNSKLPQDWDQSQLPLKPINQFSNHTPVESSHQLPVELHWITVSSLSDMELKDQPTIGS